jgi:uncharacterized protein (TIGR02246 family)
MMEKQTNDHNEIRSIFEQVYAENVKSRNLIGYGEMYTDDALWIPPNAADRHGKVDIIAGFAATIANQDIDPQFVAEEIQVSGDFGYVLGTSVAKILPHDCSPSKTVTYRALWLMKKSQNQWKIARQIWNSK